MEDRLPIVSLMERCKGDEREGWRKRRIGENRCSHEGRRENRKKTERERERERVFLNRAAAAFCWLNGKTEERKPEKNERKARNELLSK